MTTEGWQQKRSVGEDDPIAEPQGVREARPSGTGLLLRQAREERGWDLGSVAQTLRIRPEYLAALERSSLDGLPGAAYAMGFLKTYADFLGLDSLEIVRRFKAEKSALVRRPELTFPVPLTDRGIPGGGLVLIALILAVLGYGTWYYMSSKGVAIRAAVEPVPAQLLNPPPAAPQAQPSAEAPGSAATAVPTSPPGSEARNEARSAVPASSANGVAPAANPPGGQISSAASPQSQPSATASPLSPASIAALPGPDGSRLSAGSKAASAGASAASVLNAGASASGAPPPGAVGPVAPGADAGPGTPTGDAVIPASHIYGAASTGRLVVRAKAASWVQVRQGTVPIFTRILQPGDTYNVPDRPDLIMRTGNAGGIELSLDGKALPPLGVVGQVKGNIALDPAKLIAPAE